MKKFLFIFIVTVFTSINNIYSHEMPVLNMESYFKIFQNKSDKESIIKNIEQALSEQEYTHIIFPSVESLQIFYFFCEDMLGDLFNIVLKSPHLDGLKGVTFK